MSALQSCKQLLVVGGVGAENAPSPVRRTKIIRRHGTGVLPGHRGHFGTRGIETECGDNQSEAQELPCLVQSSIKAGFAHLGFSSWAQSSEAFLAPSKHVPMSLRRTAIAVRTAIC